MDSSQFLQKYSTIIQEEVNVKNLAIMDADISVTKCFIPVGTQISSKFGKDTGRIIASAKAGSVREEEGKVIVFQWNDSWILDASDYELRYEGLDEKYQSAEWNVIVSLDVLLDDSLIAEWVAREISRFLNQMRKTADFSIDARVVCGYLTDSTYLKEILQQFQEFLSDEALIREWKVWTIEEYDGKEDFENDGERLTFYLKY